MKFINIVKSPWFIAICAALIVIIVNISSISQYWSAPFVQGWDSQGHATIGTYYSDHIFPLTWGWISNWYDGMPFPQFYPPLWYFLMAVLYHVFPFISYITLFKSVAIILQISVPGLLVFFVAQRTKQSAALWLTAFFSIFLISSYYDPFGGYGMNMVATLYTGMVAQLLGFILLILWLHYFLKIERDHTARYLGGLFLVGTFLSDAHNNIVVFLIFMTVFSYSFVSHVYGLYIHKATLTEYLRKLTKHFSLYFLSGLLPLLATAFWTLPLVYTYKYFVTVPVFEMPSIFTLVQNLWILPLIIILALITRTGRKDKDLMIITSSIVVVVVASYVLDASGLPLPLHANRWFGVIMFMTPIVFGLTYEHIVPVVKPAYRSVLFLLLFVLVYIGSGIYSLTNVTGFYSLYKTDNYSEIKSYIQAHKGAIGVAAVESVQDVDTSSFVYDDLFGQYADGASTFILRESSINSVFLTPVRNTISISAEAWGFRTYLAFDKKFLNQSISIDLDRARYMGIQSFLIRSQKEKRAFQTDPRVQLVKSFGTWQLYTFKSPTPRSEGAMYQPIPFYGNLTFKERWIADYDWARIQEALLYWNRTDITLFYPHDQLLDTTTALYQSSTTIITSFDYHDRTAVIKKLLAYARSNQLIIVASQDPIFTELHDVYTMSSTTDTYHITFLDNLSTSVLDKNPLRAQLGQLFETGLALHKTPTSLHIGKTSITDSSIHVILDGTTTTPIPVIVKSSYFPAWKRSDDEPIYLTTPGFILTYATSSFELDFTTPWYVYVGWGITILTLLVSILLFLYHTRRDVDSFGL